MCLASTSIVFLSVRVSCVTCPAGAAAALSAGVWPPSLMPSLKPLTAPPRSEPMFLSYLVPNTITTISSTINQCQMENEPMSYSR